MTVTATSPATSRIVDFALDLQWSEVPERARHATRRTFANAVGLAVGSSRHEAIDISLAALVDLGVDGSAPILGRVDRAPAAWSAFIMGMATHMEDFDDTHLRTVLHPAAPIVPAALAMALRVNATGEQLLAAILAGVEVASHVGNGMGQGHFDRAWHLTGTLGHLGAAIAAGRLLGLDRKELTAAIAIAATQAQGHAEQLGSMSKPLHPGKAAADGFEAAMLARAGLRGGATPIEGEAGLQIMAPEPDSTEMVEDLGSIWEIEKNAFKPYACGIVSHPVIDAAVALRSEVSEVADIADVEVTVRPVVLEVMGVEEPENGLRSKFSVYHCFAVGYLDGHAGPAQYSDERALAPDVVALRRRVRAVLDPEMPKDACTVRFTLASGAVLDRRIEHATGSVENPMTDADLRAKFELMAAPILGDGWQALWNASIAMDDLPDVSTLFDLSGSDHA